MNARSVAEELDRHLRWGRVSLQRGRKTLAAEIGRALDASVEVAQGRAWLFLVDPGTGKTWATQMGLCARYASGWRGVTLWVALNCKAALEARRVFQDAEVPTVLLVGRRMAKDADGFRILEAADGSLRDVTTCRSAKAIAATAAGLSPGPRLCGEEVCEHYAGCQTAFFGYLSARLRARQLLAGGCGVIVATADSEAGVYRMAAEVGAEPDVVVRDEHHTPGELQIDRAALYGPLPGSGWSLHALATTLPTGCATQAPLLDLVEALDRALKHALEQAQTASRRLREDARQRQLVGLEEARYRWDRESASRLTWPPEPMLEEAAEIVRCGWCGWLAHVPGVDIDD